MDATERLQNYKPGDPPPCHPDAFWECSAFTIHGTGIAVCSVCKRGLESMRQSLPAAKGPTP
jgi:hypothetical protein